MTRARDRLIMTYASDTSEGDLLNISQRVDFDNGRLLCREASCPGTWVLRTAMNRVEAGELFCMGGRPGQVQISEHPWKIAIVQAQETNNSESAVATSEKLPPDVLQRLSEELNYRYPHLQATMAPSKQTATGLKGRNKDQEAAENAPQKHPAFRWKKPSFASNSMEAKEFGNVIHSVMQYIRYDCCDDVDSVNSEVERMVCTGLLSREEGAAVNRKMIAAFFSSALGRKLADGVSCLREFKFSILDDGDKYAEGLCGEKILLQGVVDCAILEEDGITVLDFKTDYVTEETLLQTAEKYRLQVEAYSEALGRIYEMPIKSRQIYFFRLNRFVEL